jgi:tripartite-type tricarboxylate transporter receptor subunit TctC
MLLFRTIFVAVSAALFATGAALAQGQNAVTIVVPAPPGGVFDIIARMFADPLKEVLGKPVIVDNRPGANGLLAMRHVSGSKPDGSVVGVVSSTFVANQHAMKGYDFDQLKDLTPVINLVEAAAFVAVPGPSRFKDFNEIVAFGRVNPGKLTVGTSFFTNMLDCAVFFETLGVQVTYINYNGGAALVKAMLSGEIDVGTPAFTGMRPHLPEKAIRPLAIIAQTRSSQAPDVPSVKDFAPETLASAGQLGISGPKGMPDSAVNELNAAFNKAMQDRAMIEKLKAALGGDERGGTVAQWRGVQEKDAIKYATAARIANMQPQ